MSKEKLGQEPIYPFFETNANGYGNTVIVDTPTGRLYLPFQSGMSKRFYAACAAMQAFVGKIETYSPKDGQTFESMIIEDAYRFADELLKQEHE